MIPIESVREAINDVLDPVHFYAAPPAQLEWEHLPADETPWEVIRGQLLPRHLTRIMEIFESWNVFLIQDGTRSGEPVLSLKLDAERSELHVVRGLLCWTWEGYHAGDNVYLSREVPRWLRELVGTLELQGQGGSELHEALATWLFRAAVGLSRLPLTSVEAPLPGFSLGELAYFYNADWPRPIHQTSSKKKGTDAVVQSTLRAVPATEPVPFFLAIYNKRWPREVQAKWLEFTLRSAPGEYVAEAAGACVRLWRDHGRDAAETLGLLRAVFNDVALSPYTDFVGKALAFLRQLVDRQYLATEQHVDFIGWLLRQLARHLSAYDLFTFHHRGANYPDALLLDAAVKEFLRLLEHHPSLFEGDDRAARLLRRGLRQAWLHRRRYEGHPVPDAPTSPGENMRVLPPPHVRVPDEQIVNPGKRKKRLYRGDPLPDHVGPHGLRYLQQCGSDLQLAAELRELGMAMFIERPLGAAKFPGEPDLSPLLAHEAYSRSLAERGLMELAREPLLGLSPDNVARCREMLSQPWPTGGILASTLPTEPPRVVALADAAKVASDFVILRTLPRSVQEFCAWPQVAALLHKRGIRLDEKKSWLIVGNGFANGNASVLIRDPMGKHIVNLDVFCGHHTTAPEVV
jgi:hypothetical protein